MKLHTLKEKILEDIGIDVKNNYITVEGLRRNDLVVTRGAGEIMDGQKVKIKNENEF